MRDVWSGFARVRARGNAPVGGVYVMEGWGAALVGLAHRAPYLSVGGYSWEGYRGSPRPSHVSGRRLLIILSSPG